MRKARHFGLVLAVALVAGAAQGAPAKPPQKWQIPVTTKTFSNGLTVVVSEDHSAPTFGICIVYKIGFRLEPNADPFACERLVVDDDSGDHGAWPLATRGRRWRGRARGDCEAKTRRTDAGWSWLSAQEVQRRIRPQPPCARRVAAAQGRLHCCRSSAITRISARRGASNPAPRRSQRVPSYFFHGLLGLSWTSQRLRR